MTDKILKEAFDKITAIEEADDYVPQTPEERERDSRMRDARNSTGQEDHAAANGYPGEHDADLEEASFDDIHTKAIDLLDDMLASSGDEYYKEKGEILRYAIRRLQEVGEAR